MIELKVYEDDISELGVSENVIVGGGGRLQNKSVTPTTEEQTVVADDGFDGLRSVDVGAITGELLQDLDVDFVADNIRKDADLFGVVGTFEGEDKPAVSYIHKIDVSNDSYRFSFNARLNRSDAFQTYPDFANYIYNEDPEEYHNLFVEGLLPDGEAKNSRRAVYMTTTGGAVLKIYYINKPASSAPSLANTTFYNHNVTFTDTVYKVTE